MQSERVIALQQLRVAPLMPAKDPRARARRAMRRVAHHRHDLFREQLPATQRNERHSRLDVIVDHHERVLVAALKARHQPVPHCADPGHRVLQGLISIRGSPV